MQAAVGLVAITSTTLINLAKDWAGSCSSAAVGACN